jgi:hypothetical protein
LKAVKTIVGVLFGRCPVVVRVLHPARFDGQKEKTEWCLKIRLNAMARQIPLFGRIQSFSTSKFPLFQPTI